MNKQDVFELINSSPAFFLATCEGDQPHVRGMMLYKADEDGIVFHTGTMKDIYGQIMKNPKAEMCFNDFQKGLQVRVTGVLELVQDNAVKDEIAEHPTRKFVKTWRESGELKDFYKTFAVFRLKGGKAVTWSFASNFAPKEVIQL